MEAHDHHTRPQAPQAAKYAKLALITNLESAIMWRELLDTRLLRRLGGEAAFERGSRYFLEGRVKHLEQTEARASARITGTRTYSVTLRDNKGVLDFDCNCPVGDSGRFCKHVIATALALARQLGLNETKTITPRQSSRASSRIARTHRTPGPDIKETKQSIRKTMATGGFVDYDRMPYYVQKVILLVEQLSALLQAGHGEMVMELSDYAMRRGFTALERVDDSDGEFGGLLGEIADLHWDACEACEPDTRKLAKNLYALQRLDGWCFFSLERYAPLLGETGLQYYRELAQKDWDKVPARQPGAEFDTRYLNITAIMETLAERDGDLDALVAIKSRDLSSSHSFVEIAELYLSAERWDEALDWAQRGYSTFDDEYNPSLTELLIHLLHHQAQYQEALRIAWQQFSQQPTLSNYQTLQQCADSLECWPEHRRKAISHLQKLAQQQSRQSTSYDWAANAPSLLVEIYLSEADIDTALDLANKLGCSEHLWRELAGELESGYPSTAIDIYQKLVDHTVKCTNNQAYAEAILLIKHIHELMQKTQGDNEFISYVEALRRQFKPKRNFMKMLEQL